MHLRILAALGVSAAVNAHGQSSTSDCAGAIPLCGGVYTEATAPLGTGEVYEFTGDCNAFLETASLWYTFTVQQDGALSFVLDPANDADDYDWGLFNITNGGCAGINAQDGSSPEVNCNSFGSFTGDNGPTGISSANGGTGTTHGPGDTNGPPFNADLQVQAGQTYALVVMNWSGSTDGYTIDFTQSTASLYDNVPPTVVSVEPDCAAQGFHMVFSEPILTSTVSAPDFTFTSPSGDVLAFTTATPDDPAAYALTGYTVTLNGAVPEGGLYTLTITSVAGNVEDACGNTVVETTFQVPVTAPLLYTVDISTACNGADGALQATYVSGGVPPVTFALGSNVLPTGAAAGLAPGNYVFHVVDDAECFLTQQITVPDHLIAVSVPAAQDSLSCSVTSVTIQGVSVAPAQAVNYSWNAETASGTSVGFSTSAAPEVSVPGLYTVQVTDIGTGCQAEASVEIVPTSRPTVDLSTLVLPNVISPNGDGKNDLWRPYLPTEPELDVTGLFDTYTLTIYDRWGLLVHDTNDGGARTWNAKGLPEGTYFYTVAYRADCGAVIDRSFSGSITVLR